MPDTRFKRAWHLPRILHSIAANAEVFLQRHLRPPNLNELEAGNVKSAWHHIAKTANDPEFEPILLKSDDEVETYERICIQHDPLYVITPAKAETQFKKLTTKLRFALGLFQEPERKGDKMVC